MKGRLPRMTKSSRMLPKFAGRKGPFDITAARFLINAQSEDKAIHNEVRPEKVTPEKTIIICIMEYLHLHIIYKLNLHNTHLFEVLTNSYVKHNQIKITYFAFLAISMQQFNLETSHFSIKHACTGSEN